MDVLVPPKEAVPMVEWDHDLRLDAQDAVLELIIWLKAQTLT
jgi:hypothetical protein